MSRLTFFSSTNFSLPMSIYNTLLDDCYHFDIVKNKKANISGFLNILIPSLSAHRQDLHKELLQFYNNDEELTLKAEEGIYKVYFNKKDYFSDSFVNIPFRINKTHYDDFIKIHDIELKKYNTDFTNYIRNLLVEYVSKSLEQRENYFLYSEMNAVKTAIEYSHLCHLHLTDKIVSMIPLTVDKDEESGGNIICGISTDRESAYIIPAVKIKKVVVENSYSYEISEEDCEFLVDVITEYNYSDNKGD